MMPSRPLENRYESNADHPWLPGALESPSTVTVTVLLASSAVTSLTYGPNTSPNRTGWRVGYAPRYASRLFFTTVAVSIEPSWNFTPGRRTIVHTVASAFFVTDCAKNGVNLPFEFGTVSVS